MPSANSSIWSARKAADRPGESPRKHLDPDGNSPVSGPAPSSGPISVVKGTVPGPYRPRRRSGQGPRCHSGRRS